MAVTVNNEAGGSNKKTTAKLTDQFQERSVARMGEPSSTSVRASRGNPASFSSQQYYSSPRTYAALDLGTNNCRLLVAEPTLHSFRVVDAFSRTVRLGEGLSSSNRLGEEAIVRAIDALKVCRAKMDARRVGRARLIATEACRLAINGQDFIDRVETETGISLEIVDRETEALLAVTGCTGLTDPAAESVMVFDIGGGSTEVVWTTIRQYSGQSPTQDQNGDLQEVAGRIISDLPRGRDNGHTIQAWTSLPLGVVTLAERFGGAEVTSAIFSAMVREVEQQLAPFVCQAHLAPSIKGFHLLGTSGTVTTIAGVHLKLPRYDRRQVDGLWMDDMDVANVIRLLENSSYEERIANPCIGAERADLILAGCAILEAIRRAFPSQRLRIADRGLREGMLLNMMREDNVWNRRPVA